MQIIEQNKMKRQNDKYKSLSKGDVIPFFDSSVIFGLNLKQLI